MRELACWARTNTASQSGGHPTTVHVVPSSCVNSPVVLMIDRPFRNSVVNCLRLNLDAGVGTDSRRCLQRSGESRIRDGTYYGIQKHLVASRNKHCWCLCARSYSLHSRPHAWQSRRPRAGHNSLEPSTNQREQCPISNTGQLNYSTKY